MKRVLVIVGVVIIVAALAVAAYLVAQMLTPADDATVEGGRGRNLVMAWDDGNGPTTINVHIEPNPRLPDRPMDASGILTRQEDNSIFVGTGEIQLSLEADGTSEPEVGLSHSGPEIEVVVTHDTILYQDVTEMPSPTSGADKSKEITIMQEIMPVESLENLGENCELQVWGRQQGDRIIAEVLVFFVLEIPGS